MSFYRKGAEGKDGQFQGERGSRTSGLRHIFSLLPLHYEAPLGAVLQKRPVHGYQLMRPCSTMTRGPSDVDVILPKFVLLMLEVGFENCTVFVTLSALAPT